MMQAAATVIARDLRKVFPAPGGGQVEAVGGISLRVGEGRLTALVGPDGAGKTTFLRMLAGLLPADGGQLQVLGFDVARQPQQVQDRISYMPQRFGLYEDLSVQENLDLYADLHGVPMDERRARFERLLQMTDLAAFKARPAGKLSGGMKQKLGLACTLVRSPQLLLLDEPSVGVDPLSRRELWKIIQQLVQEEHLSVLVSTAYMDEAERCEHIFVLHQGQLLAEGDPASLAAKARGLTWSVVPPAHMQARDLQAQLIDDSAHVLDAVPRAGAVRFILQPGASPADIAAALHGVAPVERPAELEDAFMMLLRAQETQAPLPVAAVAATKLAGDDAPVIVVRDLVRRFGDFTAVASTTFDVHRGEIFGLLGPNGAGKTTTFRMLCGLLPASSGHLEVAGLNLRTARAQARARIGYVSQKFALYANLTVRENLEFFGGAYGLGGAQLRQRVADSISRFDLQAQARSGELPAGYKQRLAMAVGLLHAPEILFLDEPTSGIDPLARRAFWRTITGLAQQGVTIIVTTHFMEEAEYCDRIAIQDAGELLALGTPQQVREQAGGEGIDMNAAFIGIVEKGRAQRSAGAAGRAA
ncbi:ABC transporter ATP-binding protein [Stenotrophomonas terrae]|uniref:ABC transporter ATP-binding protein n=1 Tax=Stenotrophomonas terrae TaxID=405446 RepID=A0A0R0CCB9_9GAMM|nr:ATP-binding cassette domain-containing protein [Stenotrophomonas terrae]KRG67295.1 ABC transporter ATP-binding protein [Stenotrophomonas terrae]